MAVLGNDGNRDGAEVFAKITRWLCLVSGILTIILGFISIFTKNASLSVGNGFADDANNRGSWRMALFSFTPDVFVDTWTPMVMGFVTTLVHFNSFKFQMISENFARMFVWLFVLGMFGNLGYSGGIGIIVGSFTFLADLFCLIAALIHDGPANLELSYGNKFSLPIGGARKNAESADRSMV
eukprot:GHVS01009030.1.p1 GENE.GHVS01009030.1~~GHVS01009030.1.p1  ORF type:complete len:182 (+),score=30.51 GHVS01009030.1:362-907(+)